MSGTVGALLDVLPFFRWRAEAATKLKPRRGEALKGPRFTGRHYLFISH